MRPFGALDEKILAPLNRPTTPQQVEYLKWVWNRKTGNWFKNSDYEGIEYPAPVKKYLGMK
jgi:hypothetical protein